MIGHRPFLLRTTSVHATEAGLDDVARFWAAVEWNAYLRRGTMLAVIVGKEEIVAKAAVSANGRALVIGGPIPPIRWSWPVAPLSESLV